jgi:nucleoside-diphosphate-sugar epimerase
MRFFVTGASGWIGTATVTELLGAGHQVLGLARSDASAIRLEQMGAEVHRGELDDLDSLRSGAQNSDGVIHLGYNHDFSNMEGAARTDRAAVETFGDALADTGKALVIASGLVGLTTDGRVATEHDSPDAAAHPRLATAQFTLALADGGVRSAVVRFAPTVHGSGDYGFTAFINGIAREKRVSGYIGDGANRWPAVHVLDAGRLVRLTAESAPPGTVVHAVADEGVPAREMAEAIARRLGVPVTSIPHEQAAEHFSWMARFFGMDAPASSQITREQFGWEPTQRGLIADIDAGAYDA